jgi:hypothetical protein
MQAAETLGETVGLARACESLSVARATLYRRRAHQAQGETPAPNRPPPPLQLSAAERDAALAQPAQRALLRCHALHHPRHAPR